MKYPYAYEMLDRGRNLGLFLNQLTERIAAANRQKETQRDRNRALLEHPSASPYYHPVMPTFSRGVSDRGLLPWWAGAYDADPDQAPDAVDVHSPEGGGLE